MSFPEPHGHVARQHRRCAVSTLHDAPRGEALIAEAVMCLGQKPWSPRGYLMDPWHLAVPAKTSRYPLNGFSLAT
jgi:hypothetical protein